MSVEFSTAEEFNRRSAAIRHELIWMRGAALYPETKAAAQKLLVEVLEMGTQFMDLLEMEKVGVVPGREDNP